MSEQAAVQEVPAAKSAEQEAEEERVREEQRRKEQEESRARLEEDTRKLQQALKGGLSQLGKTSDGRSMAYCRLTLAEKELERLFPSLQRYVWIRYLDISTNNIADISPCFTFKHLLSLNAAKNNVKSTLGMDGDVLPSLQILNLSTNKINTLTHIHLPSLRRLTLNQNQIRSLQWKGHQSIVWLELRKNKLKKLRNLEHLPSLVELYVCENQISDIRGISQAPALQKLSLRNNKIKKLYLPFPHLPSLRYINVRENQISSIEELKKISIHVKSVNFIANPLAQELGENAKKEIALNLPQYIKVNKSEVTIEDRITFRKEWIQKIAEKERERIEKEAQEAAAKNQGKEEPVQ